jgi:Uma2 family endonuclease
MVAPVLTRKKEQVVLEELFWPEMPSGPQPERRIVVSTVTWEQYLGFDKKLGEDRSGPRLYYLGGELEIMTTSNEHERIKEWIGSLMDVYFEEAGVEIMHRGQATMRLVKQAGAEPDKSWCIGGERQFPDLVLEVALTSGGLNKLDVYQRFRVSEVWFWRRNKLEVFTLGRSGKYETSRKSRLLPGLNIALLERCVGISSWQQARQTFRAGLSKSR